MNRNRVPNRSFRTVIISLHIHNTPHNMAGSRWIPLESNPEVLNKWSSQAGLVPSVAEFGDVYGLDEELLALVPQPVKAVVLLFPVSAETEAKREEEDEKIEKGGQHAIEPEVLWIKQTISNACGTIGLLHALANANVPFMPDSPLAKFVGECRKITPYERAKLLETTSLFADIHAEAATAGQTEVPDDLDTDLHFTCFVESAHSEGTVSRVIELDGRRKGPVDRGQCTNLLNDAARIVKDVYLTEGAGMNFNMMYLGPAIREF